MTKVPFNRDFSSFWDIKTKRHIKIFFSLKQHPSLYGDKPPVSNRIIYYTACKVLTSFVLSVHNLGSRLSCITGSCPKEDISVDFRLILVIVRIICLVQYHLFGGRSYCTLQFYCFYL